MVRSRAGDNSKTTALALLFANEVRSNLFRQEKTKERVGDPPLSLLDDDEKSGIG